MKVLRIDFVTIVGRCRLPAGEAYAVRQLGEGDRGAHPGGVGHRAGPGRGRGIRVPRGGGDRRRRGRVQQRHGARQGAAQET